MPAEPLRAGRARLWTALFVFFITLVVGGGASLLLTNGFRDRVEDSARRDALVIGTSVARTLAQQFERAARFNVPLKLIPGVDAYLADTLAGTPGIAQIVLRGPDGREIRSAVGDEPGIDQTSAPVTVDGLQVAAVEVSTNPSALISSSERFRMRSLLAVLATAVAFAVLAAILAGSHLDADQARVASGLARTAQEDFEPTALDQRRSGSLGRGGVGRALSALIQGNRRVAERRAALEAYAEELLAVDFDGALRPDVERIRREVVTRPVADKARSS
ncbi:hypothetical protein [Xanthobacter tagetidis]|jgi:hypothetical protein|uniref:HAMP domain-containing protein n=1 Tax=Xanthobacter tagetidis TaxID=60216 RepID=A0A3L6ZXX1_9HYPH|nr:hypothetical protein [Xanthobacter tagetidis]MBB6310257.1 hypothetical protein [Xanthobacter tagetidis]RLP72644.1 hypothetical protein D9R14_21480 [Xanthobacter tagetidis]